MNYVRLPGDPQGRPPYIGRNVLMQGGFVTANPTRLSDLTDLTLNQIDPDLQFEAVGDKLLFAALYAERMSSGHPDDSRFGSVPESDIGLWMLTWGGRRGTKPKLRWTPAFIFVDSPSALMTGRELYGYPKQFGRMIRRGVGEGDFSVVLRAMAFLRENPEEVASEREVLRVARSAAAADLRSSGDAAPFLRRFREMVPVRDDWSEALAELAPPFMTGMPMAFLRQMRDVTAPEEATVREISAVTVEAGQIHGAGFGDDHQITFSTQASYPIRETLGCASPAAIEAPFWISLDFRVGVGVRL